MSQRLKDNYWWWARRTGEYMDEPTWPAALARVHDHFAGGGVGRYAIFKSGDVWDRWIVVRTQ